MLDLIAFAEHLRLRDFSPATIKGYLADLRAFARWYEQTNGEAPTPEAVTPTDVREYRAWLNRRLKASTVNRRLQALRAWLDWAVAAGLSQSNPAAEVRLVREAEPGLRWLDKRERYALQRAAERVIQTARLHYEHRWVVYERDALLVLFLLHTGLRVGEVVRLTPDDLTLSNRKGQIVVRGKGNKQRVVPLNGAARKAVRRWLKVREEAGLTGGPIWSTGRGLTPRTIQRAVERIAQEAHLDGVTPHVLRHTFAKSLVDAGVGLEQVAELLGHDSMDTTRRYVLPGERDLERAVEALTG